jgi:hypothetical protein
MGEAYRWGHNMPTKTEIETKPAEITWAGRLDGGKPDPEIWSGGIPAEEFVPDRARAEQFKAMLEQYFVPADQNQFIRCIDGRPRERTSAEAKGIGPQVPGGTPAAALSYRIAIFNRDDGPKAGERRQDVLIDDMLEMTRMWQTLGEPFRIGAHEDDHAKYPNTGCGAVDNLPKIMDRMADTKARPALKAYTKEIIGEDYDENLFMETIETLRHMNLPEYKDAYLQRDSDLGTDYRDIVLAMVKKEAETDEAVEKMVGPHKEFAAIVNQAKDQTFDRDRMSQEHNNEAQIFNYDAWLPEKTAEGLFPSNEEARKLYITSRAMYFVATGMVLTNGRLELGVRQ